MSITQTSHGRLKRFRSPLTQLVVQQLVQANTNKTSKVRITGNLWRESSGAPVTDGFLSQMANNAETISTPWRHSLFLLSSQMTRRQKCTKKFVMPMYRTHVGRMRGILVTCNYVLANCWTHFTPSTLTTWPNCLGRIDGPGDYDKDELSYDLVIPKLAFVLGKCAFERLKC